MKATIGALGLVIPCYNEEGRLPQKAFNLFLAKTKKVQLVFVNDGSKDATATLLQTFETQYPDKVTLITLPQNQGKAEAVRQGMLFLLEHTEVKTLGFLDADLSTSLEEGATLGSLINKDQKFIFGSRILKLDNTIERKWHRFLIGRLVATVISRMLQLKVYDTQCGCKMFSRSWAEVAFKTPFLSRWLFDVEVFYRLKNHFGSTKFMSKANEIPLKRWIDQGDSRISWSYGIKMWWDLFLIWKHYSL